MKKGRFGIDYGKKLTKRILIKNTCFTTKKSQVQSIYLKSSAQCLQNLFFLVINFNVGHVQFRGATIPATKKLPQSS